VRRGDASRALVDKNISGARARLPS